MKNLKEILKLPSILRQVDYDCDRPVVVTVDTSPIAIGLVIGQDDVEGWRFAIRFGARILTDRQRRYLQVKKKLLEALTAIKAVRNYLIGANVVLETDCARLLGMIANCSTPDIAMLRWIAYIRSLNLVLMHISGTKNYVADMLSSAKYNCEEEMGTLEVGEDDEDEEYDYVHATSGANSSEDDQSFRENLYVGKLRHIGIYLDTME